MLNLPDLLLLESYGNSWEQYIAGVYAAFVADFITSKCTFLNLEISLRKYPLGRDGKEETFWHLVSEGGSTGDRLPDLERCKRIRWPRVIIDNAEHDSVKVWESERNGKNNICLCYGDWEYMVVLGRRRNQQSREYLLLLSGYCVEKRRKQQLKREYEKYQSQKSPKG